MTYSSSGKITAQNSPRHLVESILSHMLTYKNTSIKKFDRIESAKAAKLLIEYVITRYDPTDEFILTTGLRKISKRLTECIMYSDSLMMIDDEIGFVRVLRDIVK